MVTESTQKYFDAAYEALAKENLKSNEPCLETNAMICEMISEGLGEYLENETEHTVDGFLEHMKVPRPFTEVETKNKYVQRIEYTVKGMGGINHVTVARYLDLDTGKFSESRFYWVTCLENLPVPTVESFLAAITQAVSVAQKWNVE